MVSGKCNMVPRRFYDGVLWCHENDRELAHGVRKVSDCVRKMLGSCLKVSGRCQMIAGDTS